MRVTQHAHHSGSGSSSALFRPDSMCVEPEAAVCSLPHVLPVPENISQLVVEREVEDAVHWTASVRPSCQVLRHCPVQRRWVLAHAQPAGMQRVQATQRNIHVTTFAAVSTQACARAGAASFDAAYSTDIHTPLFNAPGVSV